jgi:hypothetical protein
VARPRNLSLSPSPAPLSIQNRLVKHNPIQGASRHATHLPSPVPPAHPTHRAKTIRPPSQVPATHPTKPTRLLFRVPASHPTKPTLLPFRVPVSHPTKRTLFSGDRHPSAESRFGKFLTSFHSRRDIRVASCKSSHKGCLASFSLSEMSRHGPFYPQAFMKLTQYLNSFVTLAPENTRLTEGNKKTLQADYSRRKCA